MSFIEEIVNCLGGALPKEPPFRAMFFGDSAVYLENVCQIISYTSEKIVLAVKKGTIELYGQNMFIKKYALGDVSVCGKITKMEML